MASASCRLPTLRVRRSFLRGTVIAGVQRPRLGDGANAAERGDLARRPAGGDELVTGEGCGEQVRDGAAETGEGRADGRSLGGGVVDAEDSEGVHDGSGGEEILDREPRRARGRAATRGDDRDQTAPTEPELLIEDRPGDSGSVDEGGGDGERMTRERVRDGGLRRGGDGVRCLQRVHPHHDIGVGGDRGQTVLPPVETDVVFALTVRGGDLGHRVSVAGCRTPGPISLTPPPAASAAGSARSRAG